MVRGTSRIRVLGLVLLLLGLLHPFTLSGTFAEEDFPPPDAALFEGTPTGDPAPEPTVEIVPTEPAPEPDPTTAPTFPPTPEPTVEPPLPPTEEPAAAPAGDATNGTRNEASTERSEVPGQATSSATSSMAGNLALSIVPDAAEILSSDPIGFTYTLTNIGTTTVTRVNLHDSSIPLNWTVRESSGNDSCTIGHTARLWCNFDAYSAAMPLAPGASLTVSIAGPAPNCAPFTSAPYAQWEDEAGSGGRPTATASVDVECVPELGVEFTGESEVWPGRPLAYALTVTNSGMVASGEVHIEGTLPGLPASWLVGNRTGMQACDLTPGPGGGTAFSCVTNPLSSGGGRATVTFTIPVFEPALEACDTTLVARVALGSVSRQVSTAVKCPVGYLLLEVDPFASWVFQGEMVDLTFRLTNAGYTDIEYLYLLALNVPTTWTIHESPGSHLCSITTREGLSCDLSAGTAESLPLRHMETIEFRVSGLVPKSTCGRWDVPVYIAEGGELRDQQTLQFDVQCPPEESGITVTKRVQPTAGRVGDDVTFTYSVRNTGTVPLTDVAVSDPLVGDVAECARDLLPTRALPYSCTATYTIGADDAVDGRVASGATASARYGEQEVSGVSGDAMIDITSDPPVTITVEALTPEVVAGEPIRFRVAVTTDAHRYVDWSIDLPVADGLSWTSSNNLTCWFLGDVPNRLTCRPFLDPTFSFFVTVTSPTTPASCGTHSAVAQVTSPSSVAITSDPATVTVICPEPSLAITRTIEPMVARIGDEITFTYEVVNTGNVTLTNLTIADHRLGDPVQPCTLDVLPAEGEGNHIHRCSATRTVPADRLVNGRFQSDWAVVAARHDGNLVTASVGPFAIDVIPVAVPELPLVTPAACVEGTEYTDPAIELVESEGLTYSLEPASGWAAGDQVIVTATLANGYGWPIEMPAGWVPVPDEPNILQATIDLEVPDCPSISISRTIAPAAARIGDDVTFTFVITNTGNVPLSDVSVGDYSLGSTISDCSLDVLPAANDDNDVHQCSVTVTITENNVRWDLGQFRSSWATVRASHGERAVAASAGPASVAIIPVAIPKLPTITQAICVDGEFTAPAIEPVATAGLTYTLEPASGWVAGDEVVVTATMAEGYAWPVEIPAGWVPVPDEPNALQAVIELEIPGCPAIEISRVIEPSVVRVGDEVTVSFEITNTGDVPLEDVYVNDYLFGEVRDCSLDVLPAEGDGNHIYRCTGTRTVTPERVRDGEYGSDWANVTANYGEQEISGRAGSFDITVEPDDVDTLTVSAGASAVTVGEEVALTIVAENTGQAGNRLYGLEVQLPDLSDEQGWQIASAEVGGPCAIAVEGDGTYLDCFVGPLVPGTSASVTVVHPTAAGNCGDVAASAILYHADGEVHARDGASVRVHCPELAMDLSAEPAAGTDVREGDELSYRLIVRNAGEIPVQNVVVDTDIAGLVDAPIGNIQAGESVTLEATYTVTAADVAAGEITRSASARGEAATGVGTVAGPATLTHQVVQAPAIGLAMTGVHRAPSTEYPLGSIVYTLTVTNTGDSTLTDIAIIAPLLSDDPIPVKNLGPKRETTIEATYALTQDDLDAGSVTNEASVGGMPPAGPSGVRDYATASTAIPQHPAISLSQVVTGVTTADGEEQDIDPTAPVIGLQAGDTVHYALVATNTGDVTLADIDLVAPLLAEVECEEAASFGPGAERSCMGRYIVTQGDIDAGEPLVSVATVSATAPRGEAVTAEASVTVWPELRRPALAITLTAAVDAAEVRALAAIPAPIMELDAGDVVRFTLVAANAGNVTLGEITVDAPMLGELTCDGSAPFGPGETIRCNGAYTVTQEDIDAGEPITVTATASNEATEPVEATLTVGVAQAQPAVTLAMTASDASGVGDVITWELAATNTGNVTLDDLAIAGAMADLPAFACDGGTTLPRGETLTCTATTTVTQVDLDSGRVTSEASVAAVAPDGSRVTATAAASVELAQEAGLEISLVADTSEAEAGDTITYTIEVSNTGTVTLRGVTLEASRAGLSWDASGGVVGDLEPGETRVLTASTTVTDDDVARGEVALSITVRSEGHAAGEVSVTSEPVRVAIAQPESEPTPDPATPVVTPTPDGDSVDVTSLPGTGSGQGSTFPAVIATLLLAALMAGGGLLARRVRRGAS